MGGTRLRHVRAAKPPLLGASDTRRSQPARGFAVALLVSIALGAAARQAVPGRGEVAGGEQRRARGPRAQRASTSDLPNVSERRERSERSELFGGATRPSSAAKSARRADRPGLSPGRVPPAAPLDLRKRTAH